MKKCEHCHLEWRTSTMYYFGGKHFCKSCVSALTSEFERDQEYDRDDPYDDYPPELDQEYDYTEFLERYEFEDIY